MENYAKFWRDITYFDRQPNQRRLQGAGVILLNRNCSKILLVNQRVSGRWGLAKGHRESAEGLLECCLRELYEETGIILAASNKDRIGNPLILVDKKYFIFSVEEYNMVRVRKYEATAEISCACWVAVEKLVSFVNSNPCNQPLRELVNLISTYALLNPYVNSYWTYSIEAYVLGLKQQQALLRYTGYQQAPYVWNMWCSPLFDFVYKHEENLKNDLSAETWNEIWNQAWCSKTPDIPSRCTYISGQPYALPCRS